MIKVFIKHYIYDICISTLFEAIKENFSVIRNNRAELIKEYMRLVIEYNKLVKVLCEIDDTRKVGRDVKYRYYSTKVEEITNMFKDSTTEYIKDCVETAKQDLQVLKREYSRYEEKGE